MVASTIMFNEPAAYGGAGGGSSKELAIDTVAGVNTLIVQSDATAANPLPISSQTNYYLEISHGNIAGHTHVHKFGRNPDIDGAFEAIWGGGGAYTGHNATAAEIVTVSSSDVNDTSAGTGARTVQVYGLDTNYLEINEIVTLAGTTLVDTVNSYIRLNRVIVRSAGSGVGNAGLISVAQKTTTANIFAVMPIGYNQTMIAAYTIPAGKTGYIMQWSAGLSGKTNASCNVRLRMRPLNEVFQVKEEFSLQGSGSSYMHRSYTTPKAGLTAKTDIFIEADTDAANTGVAADFGLILVGD